jgi:hypothetical protein
MWWHESDSSSYATELGVGKAVTSAPELGGQVSLAYLISASARDLQDLAGIGEQRILMRVGSGCMQRADRCRLTGSRRSRSGGQQTRSQNEPSGSDRRSRCARGVLTGHLQDQQPDGQVGEGGQWAGGGGQAIR